MPKPSPLTRLLPFLFLSLSLTVTFLLLLGLPGQKSVAAGNQAEDVVQFAHFSDVHIDANGEDNSRRLFKDSGTLFQTALTTLQSIPGMDFLLFTGDSVNTPKPEHFAAFFQYLKNYNKIPYFMVLGNHDVGVKPGMVKQDTIDTYRKQGGYSVFPSEAGKSYYTVFPEPWIRLLVLDGTTDEKITANGAVPQAQLDWIKQELEAARKGRQMVIMASHFPLVEPFHSESHHIVKPDADKLKALIDAYPNVVAYFAGHYHSARIKKDNGVYYVTSPALVEYPNAFRVVRISRNGKMSLQWHPSPLEALVEKSRSRSKWAATSLGNPKTDHSLSHATLRFIPPASYRD